MRQFNIAAAWLVAGVLVGCGGGAGDQSPKVRFTSQVSFGDSLSDVGSYAVSTITPYGGGGQYTINGTGKNWTELMAAQLGLAAPCPAQTGLNGTVFGAGVTVTNHPGCTSYAQGGARVTVAAGPGNVALDNGTNGYAQLGQLTVPITTQIDNHLAAGGFTGNEVVFVLAGANDVFVQLGTYGAMVGGGVPPATAATTVVTSMATAGTDLVGYINTKILANGAKYVVVVNMPDVSITPLATATEAGAPGSKALINTMVTTFNSQLQTGLANNAKVLIVDAYTVTRDEISNPAIYGLTNVTTPACDLTGAGVGATNPIRNALMCNANNLIPGVTDHYMFADDIHPTPYSHLLLARFVSKAMLVKGWL